MRPPPSRGFRLAPSEARLSARGLPLPGFGGKPVIPASGHQVAVLACGGGGGGGGAAKGGKTPAGSEKVTMKGGPARIYRREGRIRKEVKTTPQIMA